MAGPSTLLRRRELHMPIGVSSVPMAPLAAAYLAQIDRPLTALLARERLERQDLGHFIYRSSPHQILRWQVVPTISLAAAWRDDQLEVRSTQCSLQGAGGWGDSLGFSLMAVLRAMPAGLSGWAEAGLQSTLLQFPGTRGLAARALDVVLDRIERRVLRGLRKDLEAWLVSTEDGPSEL